VSGVDGKFVAVNGSIGSLMPVQVIGFADIFVKVTGMVTVLPAMGCRPKFTSLGDILIVADDVTPWPSNEIVDVAPE
jgi:hypothetical protein